MNIGYVRKKIKAVTNVQKITKAMELVSAVKMKKAQISAIEGKPYQEILEKMLAKLSRKIDTNLSPLLVPSDSKARNLIVFVATNKGLCGAYNFNLFRSLTSNETVKNCDFITVGKKGSYFISRLGGNIVADFSSESPAEKVTSIVDIVISNFLEGKNSRVLIYFNKFISTLTSEPTIELLLPFVLPEERETEEKTEYLIEPAPEEILDTLLRNFIEEKLRYIFIQNEAGEHSARMIAMKNATDNAIEVIDNLTMLRNKLRQQKITYELLDMVTAKESVEGAVV